MRRQLWGWLAVRLEPQEVEAEFREHGLAWDLKIARGLLIFAILFHLLSLPTDQLIMAGEEGLELVWGIRLVSAALGAFALVLFLLLRPSVRAFETILFVWAILLTSGIALANAIFPADYTVHAAWDVLLVLAAYTVLPLPLWRQMASAMVLTMGDIVLFGGFKTLSRAVEAPDVFTALVCANLIGIFASVRLGRWRREQFRLMRQEAEARAELDRTLSEVKTLKRIIPICSVCRKLRTDVGAWETFESYILEHTDSDFSHGVCPDCVGTFLDDEDERTTE